MIELSGRQKRKLEKMLAEIQTRCRPLLVGFGGDIACGLETRDTDLVLRGLFLNLPDERIWNTEENRYIKLPDEDVILYDLQDGINLLTACDPSLIDLLGLRPEHYVVCAEEGKMILDNADAFLSQQAVFSFNSHVEKRRKAMQRSLWDRKRDRKTLSREMTQLIRLYATGTELLAGGGVVPYRESEHELLMKIRTGKYLDRRCFPTEEYWNLLDDYRGNFKSAAMLGYLSKEPDRERIDALTREILYGQR